VKSLELLTAKAAKEFPQSSQRTTLGDCTLLILLPRHYGYPLAWEDVLAIGRDHEEAVRAGTGSDIARSLPRDKFHLRVFVPAREEGGKEALESWLDADFRISDAQQEWERARGHSGKGLDQGAGEEFEGDHG